MLPSPHFSPTHQEGLSSRLEGRDCQSGGWDVRNQKLRRDRKGAEREPRKREKPSTGYGS